jgi:Helicase conserved C-terminal domain
VLICTDLMARGVDFKGVQMVINYDLPQASNHQYTTRSMDHLDFLSSSGDAVHLRTCCLIALRSSYIYLALPINSLNTSPSSLSPSVCCCVHTPYRKNGQGGQEGRCSHLLHGGRYSPPETHSECNQGAYFL